MSRKIWNGIWKGALYVSAAVTVLLLILLLGYILVKGIPNLSGKLLT